MYDYAHTDVITAMCTQHFFLSFSLCMKCQVTLNKYD